MRSGDVLRPLGRVGHDVDVDAGGIGIEQRPRFHNFVELFEDFFLDRDALEHRFDHDIAVFNVVVAGDRLDQRETSVHLGFAEAAALDAGFVIGADAGEAAVERLLACLEQFHRESELGKAHRDAAAHRAGADDRRGLDRAQWRVARDVGEPRHLALGEKGVAQGARLGRVFEFVKEFALASDAVVERHRAGVFDRR